MAARARVRVLVTVVALAAGLVQPAAAAAHLRSGTLAVDYRVSLWHPATPAYRARIYQSDHGLTLTGAPGHVVVLLGYLGEPVFRLDGRGLWINAASPTAVAVGVLAKRMAIDRDGPVWRAHLGRHSATWHDARVQRLPAGLSAGVWHVPLLVDGQRTALSGELRRFPRPALWPWLALLAAWLVLGGWLAAVGPERVSSHASRSSERTGHPRRAMVVLAALAAAAATLATIGFALDAYASPGTWILGFDAVAFLAAGLGVLLRGPEHLRPAGAIGVGLVALAMGLFMIPVFLHAILLSVIPGALTRLLVVSAMGAGVSTAALGGREYARGGASAQPQPEPAGWMTRVDDQ